MTTIELGTIEFEDKGSNAYRNLIDELDKRILPGVMAECRYNQSRAARKLGLSRNTLRQKLHKHFGDKYVGVGNRA